MVTLSGARFADWDALDRCNFLGENIDNFISIFNEVRSVWEAKVTDSGVPPTDILLGWEFGDEDERKKFRILTNTGTGLLNIDCNEGTDSNENWTNVFTIDCDGNIVIPGNLTTVQGVAGAGGGGGGAVLGGTNITTVSGAGSTTVNLDDSISLGTGTFSTSLTISGVPVALASDLPTSSGAYAFSFTNTSSFTVTHGLETQNVIAQVWDEDFVHFEPQTEQAVSDSAFAIVFGSPRTGSGVLISANSVGAGVNTHSELFGLTADDHTQYILVDGTRGFTGAVSGVAPSQDYHLTRKDYVDSSIVAASGFLQDQIDDTAAASHSHAASDITSGVLPIARGGTGSGTQIADRAVLTDGSGNIISSPSVSATELGYLDGTTAGIQGQIDALDAIALEFFREVGANNTYTLYQSAPFAFTINSAIHQTGAGTINFSVQIDGVNVGGLASITANTSETTTSATTNNTVDAGDKVTIVTTGASAATRVSIQVNGTRS